MKLALSPVQPQLEQLLSAQDYGTAIEGGGFVASLADSPIGLSLNSVFTASGHGIPPAVDLYDRFAVWLVPIRVGIARRRGMAEVSSLGIECEFLNQGRTCCVIALLPGPQFVTWGGASGNVEFKASFSASGELLPAEAGAKLGVLPSFSFTPGAAGEVVAGFSMNVVTPYISAVGIGAPRVEWRFDRHKEALFGRDIECWAVVVLPKDQATLAMRARVYMTTKTAFFPTRRESDWQDIICQLSASPRQNTGKKTLRSATPLDGKGGK